MHRVLIVLALSALAPALASDKVSFSRQRLFPGFDGRTCKIQPSIATDGKGTVLLTWQNLLLSGDDVFYGESLARSTDGGKTFSPGVNQEMMADTWSNGVRTAYYGNVYYHRQSRRWFGLGAGQRYENDRKPMLEMTDGLPTRIPMYYAVDAEKGTFTSKRPLHVPFPFNIALPFGQVLELPDGDVLIPFYVAAPDKGLKHHLQVVRYRLGEEMPEVVAVGAPLVDETYPRGLVEPSLAKLGDKYYMTIRTDTQGLWAESNDGLNFSKPRPWRWDDGSLLENYNTQQHWMRPGGALYLSYTRKGAHNGHIFRHRAPIFLAEFDPVGKCLVRSTEVVLVPELGARLGNFNVIEAAPDESWLITAEWMQGWDGKPETCAKYGSDNSLWLAKVRFQMVSDEAQGSTPVALDPQRHATFQSDRADGRYVSTRGVVHEMVRRTRPALAFDPSLSPEGFCAWKGKVKSRLRELLSFPDLPPPPPPRRLGCERRDGYTLERWEHYPMDRVAVPYLVLVPDGVSSDRPAPAVLCLPGTSMTKESSAGEPELNPASAIYAEYVPENRMALQYCRAGFVAVAVDNAGVGETADLERIVGGRARHLEEIRAFGHHLLNLGWSYMGYAAYVDHRLLECLRHEPRIDRSRISLSGHSLGAWMAGWLTVLNDDVAAVVVNQGVYRWQEAVKTLTRPNETGDRPELLGMGVFYFIPGLYRHLDMPDIHAAIAPRPLLLAEGVPERDRLSVYEPAWRLAGRPENLTIVPFDKYKDPASRYRGDPPEGLGAIDELYGYYSNDAPRHYFKGPVAVPWLKSKVR